MVGTTWNDLKEKLGECSAGVMRTEEMAHRIFCQIIWGCGIVYTGDVLLRMIGEFLGAVCLGVAKGGIQIAACRRE
jgi:hypothetical protein